MFVLFVILVWVDSGTRVFWRRTSPSSKGLVEKTSREDVTTAAIAAADSDDILRVLGISKSYGGKRVLDDVSLGVCKDAVFALLGPNGAGKTTTFNIIRKNFLHRFVLSFTNQSQVGTSHLMQEMYSLRAHPLAGIHERPARILVFVLNSSPSTLNLLYESTF